MKILSQKRAVFATQNQLIIRYMLSQNVVTPYTYVRIIAVKGYKAAPIDVLGEKLSFF
jgi:hypothetical protein